MNESHDNRIDEIRIDRFPDDDEVIARARAIFRNACESADSYHVLRLGLARRRALDAVARHSPLPLWAPLGGIAAACCAVVVGIALLQPAAGPAISPASGSAVSASATAQEYGNSDNEVIPDVASSQMEMVQDLDFYRWVAAQPAATQAARKGGN
ncbi:MAG: hypothetical protein ACREP2_06255 [Rhodanobacteraceae bacterium]